MGASSSTPEISVIILNWNGQHLLRDCLRSLRNQTFQDFEVIVVDNGSSDRSVAFIRQEFSEVRVVELNTNLGFSLGNNLGTDAATGEYILFLNNDTEAHPAMIQELLKVIQSDSKKAGFWTLKMLHWDQRNLIDNCGSGYSAFGAGYLIGSGKSENSKLEIEWPFGASGAAGCYRRSVLDDIGLFDEDFFYNNEDIDLSFRAQLAGYRCHLAKNAIVYHRGSATGGATSDKTIYYIQRNNEWVFFKNMPTPLLWKYLALHCFYSFVWIAYWIVKGKVSVILRAKGDALRGWRTVREKRRQIQSCRRVPLRYVDSLIDKHWVSRLWRSARLNHTPKFIRKGGAS